MSRHLSVPAIALWLIAAAGLLSPFIAHAQPSVLGKNCNLAVFGEKDTAKFLAFDHDLRAALEANDVGKLALLIEFPLRIDDERGAWFIHDPASLQGRYKEIFLPVIRSAILQSTKDSIWCNYTGIAYGDDKVWINVTDRGFYLMTINMPSSLKDDPSLYPKVELACSTSKHRILIDVAKNGEAHYRAWDAGHLLTSKPDLELFKGEGHFEGTGPCSHKLWEFKTASAKYLLESTEGCHSESDDPPRNAVAGLTVTVDGKSTNAWCF